MRACQYDSPAREGAQHAGQSQSLLVSRGPGAYGPLSRNPWGSGADRRGCARAPGPGDQALHSPSPLLWLYLSARTAGPGNAHHLSHPCHQNHSGCHSHLMLPFSQDRLGGPLKALARLCAGDSTLLLTRGDAKPPAVRQWTNDDPNPRRGQVRGLVRTPHLAWCWQLHCPARLPLGMADVPGGRLRILNLARTACTTFPLRATMSTRDRHPAEIEASL